MGFFEKILGIFWDLFIALYSYILGQSVKPRSIKIENKTRIGNFEHWICKKVHYILLQRLKNTKKTFLCRHKLKFWCSFRGSIFIIEEWILIWSQNSNLQFLSSRTEKPTITLKRLWLVSCFLLKHLSWILSWVLIRSVDI